MKSSQNLENLSIRPVDPNSPYLNTIKQLADQNSGTLGFLPYGAFDRMALEKRIIACISEQDECIGYLIFCAGKNRIKLTHLCVSKEFRGKGIPSKLLNYLKETTSDLQGILLSCRRDYNLSKFWSTLGFVAQGEREGRAKEGSTLTEWWLSYGKPDLFSILAEQQSEINLCVVIDANIFFDLTSDQCIDEGGRESKALLADWLSNEMTICLTDEIRNEINRNPDAQSRSKLINAVSEFIVLDYDRNSIGDVKDSIKHLFPENMKESDRSDLDQIAKTITAKIDISFFITRDNRLLEEVEEEVYQRFGLRIVSPIEFIVQQDQLRRDSIYQPVRLAGTSTRKNRVSAEQKDTVITSFLANKLGETKPSFRSKINLALSDPLNFECILISNSDDEYLALIVVDRSNLLEFKVPILRFKPGKISSTLIRHCIFDFCTKAASESKKIILISDKYLTESITEALKEDNFISQNGNWLRVCLPIGGTSKQVSEALSSIKFPDNSDESFFVNIAQMLYQGKFVENASILNLEKILYPARLLDADIPIFIIPIKAKWAKELFDPEIANEYLWGAQEELALNREGVYYRSNRKTCNWEVPGRILWYVSEPTNKDTTVTVHAIRAISFLNEITTGTPKDLYKQFRRLGVYNFEDVLATSGGDHSKEIMAIKFSETQLLRNPVKITRIKEILGNKTSLPAPLRISSHQFSMIYNEGI